MTQVFDLQKALTCGAWGMLAILGCQVLIAISLGFTESEDRFQVLAPAIVLLCMLAPVVGLLLYATGKGSIRVLISALVLASLPMLGAVDGIFQRWVPVKNQWADAKDQFNDPALAEMAKYIWRGDTASMKTLESKGNPWRQHDRRGELLIYAAAEALQPDHGLEPVHAMLELGQSPRIAKEAGQILYRAASDRNDTAEQLLGIWLKAGADPNATGAYGERALHAAKRFPKRAKMLLEHGADINVLNKDGYTAVMFAARDHSGWKTARLLVDSGADLKHKAPDGMTLTRIVNEQLLDFSKPPEDLARLQEAIQRRR